MSEKKMVIIVIFFIFLCPFYLVNGYSEYKTTQALMVKLFSSYEKNLVPICDETDLPITVRIGIAITHIFELDEPNQVLTSKAWLRWLWKDCKLSWNRTEYNVGHLSVEPDKIWFPDITLYDNAEHDLTSRLGDYHPVVYSDGTVAFYAPTIIKSTCKIDVHAFPFDRQNCSLKFGSWRYSGLTLDITNKSMAGDSSMYITNGEWNLVDIPVKRNVFYYGSTTPWPDVTFQVILQRKSLYYTFNLIFPCILMTLLAMTGFALPPESGEKVSLGITVLLSACVVLLLVSESVPTTSETIPLLSKYIGSTITLVCMSTVVTVLSLGCHHRGAYGRPVPGWMKKLFFNYIGRILCIVQDCRTPDDVKEFVKDSLPNTPVKIVQPNITDVNIKNENPHILHALCRLLYRIEGHLDDEKKSDDIRSEWQLLARIIDRILLILFSSVMLIISLLILLGQS